MAMNEIEILKKKGLIETEVKGKVSKLISNRQLVPASDYNVGNAINSAMLVIQDTKDKNLRPVLEVCTQASIGKCVLDMVIQGLQPVKKQCYFIAYADQLTLFRGYFGTVAALKRAMPEVAEVKANPLYEGQTVIYDTTPFGETYVHHTEGNPLEYKKNPIIGGYCTIYGHNNEILATEIMTWDQIQTSWKQSRNYKADGGVHQKFPEEMARRTLVSRACKFLLNTSLESSTDNLVVKAFNDTTDSEFIETQEEQKPEPKKESFKERYGIGTKSNPSDNGKVEETNNKAESAAEEEEIPWPEADEAMTDGGLF